MFFISEPDNGQGSLWDVCLECLKVAVRLLPLPRCGCAAQGLGEAAGALKDTNLPLLFSHEPD